MSRTVLVVVALLLTSCARHLVPGPGAQLANSRGKAVIASDAGVTVTARVDAWRGFPRDIDDTVTPLLVTIDNQHGRPLRLRYEYFVLRGPGEARYTALTPYDIEGYTSEPIAAMPYGAFDPYWPRPFWSGAWHGAYGWYGPYGWYDPWPSYVRVRLPTTDMVRQSLAEATLEPGARTSGFTFFERATRKKGTPLEFTMDLVDASTGERFGQVRMPFVVE